MMQALELVLSNSPLFNGIAQEDIGETLAYLSAVRKEYGKFESIIHEGDIVDSVGILLSGLARSEKTDSTGKLTIATLIAPGGYIGVLLSASCGRTSPVSVRALERLSVLFVPVKNIIASCDCPHHSQLIRNLLDGVAEKALVLHDRNDCLIKPTIRDKVLTFLSRFSRDAGSDSFTIPMGRDAMAEYLNTDRSALSRELSEMKRDGMIDYKKNWFKLKL